jgi:hypothetical protein
MQGSLCHSQHAWYIVDVIDEWSYILGELKQYRWPKRITARHHQHCNTG